MSSFDFWIIVTGLLVVIPSAILGSFLLLRKMVMVGDAISHAVLPGIVIAFLFSGTLDSLPMLFGAGAVGLFSTFLIELFHKKGRLQEDASIGVTFTWLFALGIILISTFTRDTDLDQDCVLYGDILFVGIDTIEWMGMEIPRASLMLLLVNMLVFAVTGIGFKEFKITTFDPAFAKAVGIPAGLFHYLLMGMVSFHTVASFDAVGAILVVAFLVAPAATAYLLTDRLKRMLFLSVLFGTGAVLSGFYLSVWWDVSPAAAMATMGGVFFAIVLIASPKHGIFRRKFAAKLNAQEKFPETTSSN